MPKYDINMIEKLAKLVPSYGRIVEVGSCMGRSTVAWANFSHPTVEIIAIDEFFDEGLIILENHALMRKGHPQYEDFKNNYEEFQDEMQEQDNMPVFYRPYRFYDEFLNNTKMYKNIKHIRGNSPYINYTAGPIDLFFLDAAHSNPSDWDNLKFFSKFVKKGGIISGHDWYPPERFLDIHQNISRLEDIYQVLAIKHEGTSIWSIEVTKYYDEVKHLFGN